MKKFFIVAMALFLALGVSAQKKQVYNPQGGDFSIGVTFNPLAIKNHDYQPDMNAWSGDFVKGLGGTPKQMFILSTDPLVSFMIGYHFSDLVSLRANIGVTGSNVNYRQYVRDDAHLKESENADLAWKYDAVKSKLNGTTIGLGLEFTKPFGRLAFVGGFGIQYAIGGGSMAFTYGNALTKDLTGDGDHLPSQMSMTSLDGDGTLNEWKTRYMDAIIGHEDEYVYATTGSGSSLKITPTCARPVERRNVGMIHGIGITADMGIEYFFAGRMSIGASVSFIPIMVVFQPQTYTKYEVYNKKTDESEIWDQALVSPGSRALLYGTQNIGLRFAFKYYM